MKLVLVQMILKGRYLFFLYVTKSTYFSSFRKKSFTSFHRIPHCFSLVARGKASAKKSQPKNNGKNSHFD